MCDYKFVGTMLFAAPLSLANRCEEKDNEAQKYRTMFMRDRDRILYSKAFRRLAGKTQIYSSGIDDHRRTRLTHTLEVSQIAGTISSALGLDRDLTEAIALGHDIGHTPFGHAGEQILHEIMVPGSEIIKDNPMINVNPKSKGSKDLFGFKHNMQSVRMAVSLENIYGNFGLDLTNYTLWGIQFHSSSSYNKNKVRTKILDADVYNIYNNKYMTKDGNIAWSFEAFVVKEADEIAQWHHDLEDAIRGKAMTRNDVHAAIKKYFTKIMAIADKDLLFKMHNNNIDDETFIIAMSRVVVNTLVNRIIECSLYNLNFLVENMSVDKTNVRDFFLNNSYEKDNIKYVISYEKNDKEAELGKALEKYPKLISEKVHHSMVVERMNLKGQYIIRKIFEAYYANPQQLPNHSIIQYLILVGKYKTKESAQKAYMQKGEGTIRAKSDSFLKSAKFDDLSKIILMRVICDHIASMTDSYAISEYHDLYE